MLLLLCRRAPILRKAPRCSSFTPFRSYIRPYYDQSSGRRTTTLSLAQRLDRLDEGKVLWTVIGVNVGVYGLWQYGINNYKQFGDAGCLQFMLRHFMNSPDAWENGRWHTLLSSAFSHKDLDHLGLNMLVLYSIGQGVLQAIGNTRFLLLYGGAGIAGSLATLMYRKYIRPRLEGRTARMDTPSMGSLGASGSVMGITSFFACAFPKATFLVFFVIPMPAVAVVGLFAAYDVYKATTLNQGIVDSAAHIGGIMYGCGYYFLRVKPMLRMGRWRV